MCKGISATFEPQTVKSKKGSGIFYHASNIRLQDSEKLIEHGQRKLQRVEHLYMFWNTSASRQLCLCLCLDSICGLFRSIPIDWMLRSMWTKARRLWTSGLQPVHTAVVRKQAVFLSTLNRAWHNSLECVCQIRWCASTFDTNQLCLYGL